MAFKEGNSANPGGRPKKSNPAAMAAKQYALKAIEYQASVMNDPGEKTENRLKASEYIVTRAWGKPVEAIELSGDEENPIRQKITVELVRANT